MINADNSIRGLNYYYLMTSLKSLFIIFYVFKIAIKVASSNEIEEITEDNNVLILTDNNYEAAISKYPSILIKFYAPWCGHCKKLAPEFEKAAEELKNAQSNARLAKLDCTVHTKAAEIFEIQSYPSLKFFKAGNTTSIDYNGERSAEAIVAWIAKKTSPIIARVNDLADFDNYLAEKDVVVVYFGDSEADLALFNAAAENYENLVFLTTVNTEITSTHNKESKKIVLFKKFDELRNEFEGEFSAESLENFIEVHSFPLVSGFTEDTIDYLFNTQRTGIYLYRKKDVHIDEEKLVRELASKYKDKLITIITDIADEVEQKLAEYMDISESELPCIKIHDVIGEELRKYSMRKPITPENIDEFINQFFNGELAPEYKSEEVTEQPADQAIIKVVGKTFDKIVNDSTKDVLVIFHAPWCGHCKSFLPKIENVAKLIQSIDSFVIAKFDATANDVPGLNIEGYPTIKFYPSNSKDTPIDYNKGRSENEVLSFLREFHTIKTISEDIKVEEKDDGIDDILKNLEETEQSQDETIEVPEEKNEDL